MEIRLNYATPIQITSSSMGNLKVCILDLVEMLKKDLINPTMKSSCYYPWEKT